LLLKNIAGFRLGTLFCHYSVFRGKPDKPEFVWELYNVDAAAINTVLRNHPKSGAVSGKFYIDLLICF